MHPVASGKVSLASAVRSPTGIGALTRRNVFQKRFAATPGTILEVKEHQHARKQSTRRSLQDGQGACQDGPGEQTSSPFPHPGLPGRATAEPACLPNRQSVLPRGHFCPSPAEGCLLAQHQLCCGQATYGFWFSRHTICSCPFDGRPAGWPPKESVTSRPAGGARSISHVEAL